MLERRDWEEHMKEEIITRMSLEEAVRRKGKGQTDWERLRREQEAGLEPEVDPDEGEFDWSQARVVMPPSKQAISVRIDRDVLEFFRSQGRGYQTRINAFLRSYMEAKQGGCRDRFVGLRGGTARLRLEFDLAAP